jgi:hypothetical protein
LGASRLAALPRSGAGRPLREDLHVPDQTPDRRSLDFADPRDNVYAFAKMWGTFADVPTIGVFHGLMYAWLPGERLRPLFGYAGTGVTKCRQEPDGSVTMRGKETGYFYDTVTGEVIDAWENPWTGETVEVYPFLNDRIGGRLTLEMPRLHLGENEAEGSQMNDSAAGAPFVLPWQVYGDEVLLEWDYAHLYTNPLPPAAYPRSSTGSTINPSEHFTIYTSLAELEDRSLPSAHFRAGFSRVSPWWPWMRMGDGRGGQVAEGVMTGRLFSRSVRRGLDDIPRPLLERIERDCPDYLELPADWEVGPILSSWEAYARDTPPEA